MVFPAGIPQIGYLDVEGEAEFVSSIEHYLPLLHVKEFVYHQGFLLLRLGLN